MMSPAHRAWCSPAIVATVLVAIACTGCSTPGGVHADASSRSDMHADIGSPGARADASAASAKEKTTSTRNSATARAEADLRDGIQSYEDAEYDAAVRKFQSALTHGLKAPGDKATAHKYLAFVACTSNKMKACQAQFRYALEVDPAFDLAPAEAGHPIWGPVFRNVKLDVNAKARTRPAYATR